MPALKHGGVFMNCDGIILDIDGTIWDTTFIVADAWNLAIEKNFPSVPRVNAGLLKTQFGKPMNVIADSLFTGLDEVQKKRTYETVLHRRGKSNSCESEKHHLRRRFRNY